MNALRERTDAPHAERIRDLLTAEAGIVVRAVSPAKGAPGEYVASVSWRSPLQLKRLTVVMTRADEHGYFIQKVTGADGLVKQLQVKVL